MAAVQHDRPVAPPQPGAGRRFLRATGKTILMLLLFFITGIVAAFPGVVAQMAGGIGRDPQYLAIHGAIGTLLWLAVLWLLQVVIDKRPWVETGLRFRRRALGDFAFGGGIAVAVWGLITVVLWAAGAIEPVTFLPAQKGWGYTALLLAAGLVMVLGIGVSEEGLFRGYMIPYYSRYFGRTVAVIASSAIFSAVHLADGNYSLASVVIEIFLAGVLLALMWRHHGSLWVPVGFHALWDFMQIFVVGLESMFYLQPEALVMVRSTGASWLNHEAVFGKAGSLLEFVAVAAMVAYYLYRVRQQSGEEQN